MSRSSFLVVSLPLRLALSRGSGRFFPLCICLSLSFSLFFFLFKQRSISYRSSSRRARKTDGQAVWNSENNFKKSAPAKIRLAAEDGLELSICFVSFYFQRAYSVSVARSRARAPAAFNYFAALSPVRSSRCFFSLVSFFCVFLGSSRCAVVSFFFLV